MPGRGGLPSITAERADAFGHPTSRQKRQIRHVSGRGHASKFPADGADQLGLRERLVVTDVVGLPQGPVAVERKQQRVHNVGDVHKRHRISARADDDGLSAADAIRDASEVHAVAGTE